MPADDRLWARWDDVDALLARALERPSDQRAAFLADAAPEDMELQKLVSRLLGRLTADPHRVEAPAEAVVAGAFGTAPPLPPDSGLAPGTAVGRYMILRRRARGGMATVYEAERADGEYRQRVALKILRRGLDTEDLVRRFLTERQILSSLSHPNIARLLDGGSTPEGRPFLVMELVEGRPITDYADEHGLEVPARLALFVQVAEAVDAAHRQLVVHRDIKPSNILVDTGGRVKLLDFGIAKLLDTDAEHTRVGSRAITPDYASPEQLTDGLITTATDVYQLGLLLRELLTGLRPRASATESEHGERRRLTGDLAIIVAKALRAEPQERYPSASALAMDVRRHLAGHPITAHPESRMYRLRKFMRRNPWGVAAGAISVVALVGYVLTITVHSRRLAEERDRAGLEAMKAEQVTEFVLQLFRSADPNEGGGAQVTARELLDRGAEQVGRAPGGDPAVRAAMLAAIGRSYYQLGLYSQAQSVLERTLNERRAAGIDQDRETAADLALLAEVVGRTELDRGLDLFQEALALAERTAGPRDPLTARILADYAMLRERRGNADTRSMLDRATAILRAAPGDNRAALAHVLTQSAYGRDPEEALPLMRQGLSLRRSLYGEVHSETAAGLSDLALATERVDPLAADSLMLASLEILETLHGRRHATTLIVMNNLAGLRRDRGEYARAAPLYREVLTLRRELYPADRRSHAYALYGLGLTLSESGNAREGEGHLREALAILKETEVPGSPLLSLTRAAIGYALARQQRFEAAEPLLIQAHSEIRASNLVARERVLTLRRVIWMYRAWGRPDEAAEYQTLLDERLAAPPAFRITTDDVWLNLHHFLYVLGRAELGTPDASRRAVAGAPEDQARGLESLSPADRETWRAAVATYAEGPSRLDPVFDDPLIEAGGVLARLGNAASLEGSALDPELRRTIEAVMPIYRRAWWPAHRTANARWLSAIEPLVTRHGDAILDFVTRAYELEWPEEGYPVHIVAYSNWAGAFSTRGDLLLVASLDPGNTGLSALETVFHEAMHQWDEPVWEPLLQEARDQGRYIPQGLTHAMIFMAAGAAVRSVAPDYVPYADANGLWERGMGVYKPALDAAWLPYLQGNGTREEAFAELVRRMGEAR